MVDNSWHDTLRDIRSLGSRADRPGSLAALHDARREHLGQFFTPTALAGLMWQLVYPSLERAPAARKSAGGPLWILDNSVGTGRLLQFAEPGKHALAGVDVHEPTIAELMKVATAAGFQFEFEAVGMEQVSPTGFAAALINPPFSLHLQAPTLQPLPCTAFGRFGPSTSATSHEYALDQALAAADIVVALLPATFAATLTREDFHAASRLRALVHPPRGSFREEGTEVEVTIAVFDSVPSLAPRQVVWLNTLEDPVPDLHLHLGHSASGKLRPAGIEASEPAILLPVTGDRLVRVVHDGRRIKLKFRCGLVEAKVMNGLLRERIEEVRGPEERYPKKVRFTGQGAFDTEVHLLQSDPIASFESLVSAIRELGGEPEVDPGLVGYLRNRRREVARDRTPVRHTVWMEKGSKVEQQAEVVAKATFVTDPKRWGSPVVQAGSALTLHRQQDGTYAPDNGWSVLWSIEEVRKHFLSTLSDAKSGWVTVHEGVRAAFPQHAQLLQRTAEVRGLYQWLTWSFQPADVIEHSMKSRGSTIAWKMGLGKGRLGAALIILNGCKHGLIVVQAYLVPEIEKELRKLPIPHDEWQIIEKPPDGKALQRINVISAERLGRQMPGSRKTYASLFRRRIGVIVVDEGEFLANPTTDQSRGVWQVSAKKRYITTGTPIANYPRDLLPILAYTAGDGTAAMPYGWRGAKLESWMVTTMQHAKRGVDAFREDFVTLEWVTHEFAESMTSGAKREVPKIANLHRYRELIAPHVGRRVDEEPEVAKDVRIPKPTTRVITAEWDAQHLGFYLKAADEFAAWYRQTRSDRRNNLVALLARIGAVEAASNHPQAGVANVGRYMAITSKQRLALERLEQLTDKGHKTILYAKNPGVLEILAPRLSQRGIDSVVFHGGKPIKARTRELDTRFRDGNVPVLFATRGCTQSGLNVPEADRVLFYGRSWSAKEEGQCMARVLRPQQKREVAAEFLHLEGAIDEYQAQLVAFKADAANAALDWAAPEMEDVEFLHLNTVLERFIENLATLHGKLAWKLRNELKEMAA